MIVFCHKMNDRSKSISANYNELAHEFRISAPKELIEITVRIKSLKPSTYARQIFAQNDVKDITEVNEPNPLILNDHDWQQFVVIKEAPLEINDNLRKAIICFNELTEQ